ncbi:MAG: TIGR01906 family membrane protein [Dehalococcoidales bacterium]|nr:TIGR01906 family membrane protein [Dehalococcoidales bacterium]
MRIIRIGVIVLFCVCLPVFLLATVLRLEINTQGLYEDGFERYNISGVTGISQPELKMAAHQLIDYFNGNAATPQINVLKLGHSSPLYNLKELTHLEDVRGLVQMLYVLQWVTLGLLALAAVVLIFLDRRFRPGGASAALLWGGVVTLSLAGIFALWSVFGFNSFFILFHQLSFTNDLWLLDPSRDYLIMMFPGEFFYRAALIAFCGVVGSAVIFIVLGWYLRRRVSPMAGAK